MKSTSEWDELPRRPHRKNGRSDTGHRSLSATPCTLKFRVPEDALLSPSDLATEFTLAGDVDCNEPALDDVVALYLEQLAEGQVATLDFCAAETENAYVTQHRLHAMFGQCQMNAFRFKLNHNDSVENWLRLYAAAIRCSIQPCGRGFVFVTWVFGYDNGVIGRHATTLYFDVSRNTQVFIDPSGCLAGTDHSNVLKYFQNHHVWLPKSKHPDVSTNRAGPACCLGSALW